MSAPLSITYPAELPVSARRDDIARAIAQHQVVIVAGETGSGKTTQLPKILLELGRESIGHTQPRRLAARTIAERIAEELGVEVGGLVGYQVRFTDQVSPGTRIKLMTEGILLNELQRDRMLRRYDTIIIDEAHERSLGVDFLLGYLATLLPKRPELKLVITSATIETERFAAHFADASGAPAPVIEVSGRTFPVELRYRPLVADPIDPEIPSASPEFSADKGPDAVTTVTENGKLRKSEQSRSRAGGRRRGPVHQDRDLVQGVTEALAELAREAPGDVLVFLSGENEIRDVQDALSGSLPEHTEVLPLFGRLSAADQHRVFETKRAPGIRRRIVLATNVAETSLTVPGIKYVIDAGTARISRYSVRAKVQRLPIEPISQASANQRSGRAGRTSEGIAIRLYSEDDFAGRPEYTDPEILRTNLAAVILQMISLGLGDIQAFPFLQPPDSRGVKDGLELLRELQAIDVEHRITKIGRQLAQLPVDPRFGRMIIESGRHGVTREVMAVVAGLSIQDPRERPLEQRAQADQAHARFTDRSSDFLTLLNLWRHLQEKERELSGNQFRRMCRAEHLNYLRVREWGDVYRQLRRLAKPLGLSIAPGHVGEVDADALHRSLLAGLLSQLGIRDERKDARGRGEYLGSRGIRFSVFPGSALAKKQPAEIMSAELVETSRLFARMNARIDLSWAEPIAGDLVKKQHSEPHWEQRRGSAVAFERVTLYGVPIVARRRVQLARIDLALARELFIRHALVLGELQPELMRTKAYDFLRANEQLRGEVAEVEERQRRRDLLLDDEAVVEFYEARIPDAVTDVRSFERWWRQARAEQPQLLTLTRADLLGQEPERPLREGFPDTWHQDGQTLRLSYRFEPGSADDGVTVHVPLALLPGLSPAGFDWQVPGLRTELVTALIKALPKAIRRNVVPAADWAARLLEGAPEQGSEELSLLEFLAAQIRRQTYTPVDVEDFELERVPAHLLPTFAVEDAQGRRVAAGNDLVALQRRLQSRARQTVATVHERTPAAIERAGLTAWDFGALPESLDTKLGNNTVRGYPALVDEGSTVAIRVLETPEAQALAHRRGVLRLLQRAVPAPSSYLQQNLSGREKLALARSPYRSTGELFDDIALAVAAEALGEQVVRTRAQFEAVRDRLSAMSVDTSFAAVALTAKVLEATRDAEKAIAGTSSLSLIAPLADAREQLEALVHPGFVSRTGLAQLRRVPVYLAGVVHRVDKLADQPGRDRTWLTEVQAATQRYREAGGQLPQHPDAPAHLIRARWLLEELRLSLFAQHLGTTVPVSLKRITKSLSE